MCSISVAYWLYYDNQKKIDIESQNILLNSSENIFFQWKESKQEIRNLFKWCFQNHMTKTIFISFENKNGITREGVIQSSYK